MKKNRGGLLVLLIILMISTMSCSRKLGYGVIMWSDQDGLNTGVLTKILKESRIRESYILEVKDTKDRFEIPVWRVRFFEKSSDAEKFASSYEEYIHVFAYSNKQGLPMREEASTSSERIYKLREGQEIKILGRGEKEKVGRFDGFWYTVLSDDGVEGYVFDALLTVYSLNDQQEMIVQNQKDTSDPLLDSFFGTAWRPDTYQGMISRRQIDLALFRPDYGLYADLENMTISLKTIDKEVTETFDKVTRIGANRYDFSGTSFRITINSEYFISVQFKYDGLEISQAFIKLPEDVNTTISREKERRTAMLQDFIDRGPEMSSQAYGTILFENAGRFTWIEKSSLISQQVLTVSAGNSGYVSFRNFPSDQIRSRYDGVITFNFESGETADFLYTMRDAGASLLYVDERYIIERIVTNDQFFSPIQMFFTFPDKISELLPLEGESEESETPSAEEPLEGAG
ncbi:MULTISPECIES: SH3 domain-containing protein [unclassified Oceanispirochaeta]|uniref:SH3 domain-containing protein n=1 Tax=unclassified Oceanispirochaeta TaxID=2635722 RepID=UPI000E09463B|nr:MULTISPECIES: SH3 domain-containing protein [unclassified Oceanispirochaeta]MBF9014382.1 SH3 domain-containing protein [Oceanispirochaeta sp. M2]NPD71268.1 SH3 domain-containing protein [Oceanispirochaeta sp. M1]RDG33651.1 SH3 domain-containing protein [Oceanispirochaeta sp. M1]